MSIDSTFAELLVIAKQIGAGEIPRYQHSESFNVGAVDMAFSSLRDHDAFQLISHACGQYDVIKTDAETLTGVIFLLADLARQSGTTEMPPGMQRIIRDNPSLTSELREWYRVAFNL